MSITARPYAGAADLPAMYNLVAAFPANNTHVVDFPYRLSAPAIQTGPDLRLWEDAQGNLVGWAVWQPPWATLDYAIDPHMEDLDEAIIAWALERFPQMARQRHPNHRLHYTIDANESDSRRIALLERYGFVLSDRYVLRLARSLDTPIPEAQVPQSFTIRPLAGESEVPAYVELHRAAFGSTMMTVEWRQRTLGMPQYVSDLDLVMVAPDGRLAAFCVGWLSPRANPQTGRQEAHVEPLGVHPDFQRLGLGRAVLREGLRRMQAYAADIAFVDVYHDNPTAEHLYLVAGGFRPAYKVLKYYKVF